MDFSPKAAFAKGPFAAQWTELASSKMFTEAAGVAMFQMQLNQGMALPHEAARNCHQMEGARIFLSILMNLTTPPEQMPKRVRTDNLDHSV